MHPPRVPVFGARDVKACVGVRDSVRTAVLHAGFEVAVVLAELMIASQEWQAVKCTETIVISS